MRAASSIIWVASIHLACYNIDNLIDIGGIAKSARVRNFRHALRAAHKQTLGLRQPQFVAIIRNGDARRTLELVQHVIKAHARPLRDVSCAHLLRKIRTTVVATTRVPA